MGMSIDEATRILNNFDGLSLTDEDELSEAIRKAIDTMRKYQKIEEIIDNWTKPEQIEWEIRKVLEDGNDD